MRNKIDEENIIVNMNISIIIGISLAFLPIIAIRFKRTGFNFYSSLFEEKKDAKKLSNEFL